MRTGPKVKHDAQGVGNYDFQCDHAETPDDVMQSVHLRLKEFGLEVVSHESDSDYYAYSIRKIRKTAEKKPKVHPLTKETLKALGTGLKMFGEYTFGDKGPHEVLDIDSITAKYRALPASQAAKLLLELSESKEHKGYGADVAGSILGCLQDWTELFEQPEILHIDW